MNSNVNSKVNSKWKAFDTQLLISIQSIKMERGSKAYFFGPNRDDWLDAMRYGLLFGTPEEVFRLQAHATNEAEREGRPYTPVFWTASDAGAEPVLTLWRIE